MPKHRNPRPRKSERTNVVSVRVTNSELELIKSLDPIQRPGIGAYVLLQEAIAQRSAVPVGDRTSGN